MNVFSVKTTYKQQIYKPILIYNGWGPENKGYIHYTVNKTQFQEGKRKMAELKFEKTKPLERYPCLENLQTNLDLQKYVSLVMNV